MALSELPCSGLGRKADIDLTVRTMAFLLPTDTFRDRTSFKVRTTVTHAFHERGCWPTQPTGMHSDCKKTEIVCNLASSSQAGGLTFELVEAHGETHDQLFVYIPEKRTLLPGDNYYQSFPNLYSIRGTSPRCVGCMRVYSSVAQISR